MPEKPPDFPSARQTEVLKFIIQHVEERGFQPTMAEIGEHFGVTAGAVRQTLLLLQARGFLTTMEGRDRALALKHVRFRAEWVGPA